MTAPDPTTDDVTVLAEELWADSASPGAAPTDAHREQARVVLASSWLAERDARVRAEAAAEARRETTRAIDAWETQESVDVLTKGAWSDGVRYGLEVARQIVERGESL